MVGNCRACRSDRLDLVFEMDPMPLAGAFAATADEARAMPKYPLAWYLCDDCGLVNVYPDIPDEVIYGTYSYAASTVPALVRHHADFAAILTERYETLGTVALMEIGGNDGVLLDRLPPHWMLINVDPSDVARRAAKDARWLLADRSFTSIRSVAVQLDVITASNSFAHFSDIAGALDKVATFLKLGGEFWVEVHDLDATLRSNQWDTIYHEHKVEWSLDSLVRNAARRGLGLVDSWTLPLHGGLIRALFRKGPVPPMRPAPRPIFLWLKERYRRRAAPPLAGHSAAYGAAARATVYLNQMWPLPIDYVVDGSPLRAGKFVPGIGIPVLEPWVFEQDAPETTLVTAWNHASDIRAKHPHYDGWVSAW